MVDEKFKHSDITDKAIRAYYNVYNILGYGFLEKVYENAMMMELAKFDLKVTAQKPIKVFYDNKEVGSYFADIVVNDCVILELKAAETLCEEHEAQLLNYLKATEIEVGLLMNFGKIPQFKKKVFSNEFKQMTVKEN
ncbi:MAG TPA: GxxExxY protein [Chitinophagales bacterium]|nr:GxxExxY protein [Chitinophagales bacterium]